MSQQEKRRVLTAFVVAFRINERRLFPTIVDIALYHAYVLAAYTYLLFDPVFTITNLGALTLVATLPHDLINRK